MKIYRTSSTAPRLRPRFHFVHGPGLIRRGDVSWRNFNGFAFQFFRKGRWITYWFELRGDNSWVARYNK